MSKLCTQIDQTRSDNSWQKPDGISQNPPIAPTQYAILVFICLQGNFARLNMQFLAASKCNQNGRERGREVWR